MSRSKTADLFSTRALSPSIRHDSGKLLISMSRLDLSGQPQAPKLGFNAFLQRQWQLIKSIAMMTAFITAIIGSQSCHADSDIGGEQMPYLAKWYDNKDAAVSLRFDDASETHVETVTPILNQYGIKGTFMVNPGRRSYKKHKDFWEKELPLMGHRLGNHTWNHKGAKTIEEAEREIGSVSELIWRLYPNQSKLNVFASGGGEKWAGGSWDVAPPDYRQLTEKYHLIDLYDGNHPSKSARSHLDAAVFCQALEKAAKAKSHQPFSFHRIGEYDLKDWVRKILGLTIYTFSRQKFERFIECLTKARPRIWIANIVQIYKYQAQFQEARLKIVKQENHQVELKLNVKTDPNLFDQTMTIVLPNLNFTPHVVQIIDGVRTNQPVRANPKGYLSDIKPENSDIIITAAP